MAQEVPGDALVTPMGSNNIDYGKHESGMNEIGQFDNDMAWEVAHGIKPEVDSFIETFKAKADAWFEAAKKGLKNPEVAAQREIMEWHMKERPHTWDQVITPDGDMLSFAKLPRTAQENRSLVLTDTGPILLSHDDAAIKRGDFENWALLVDDSFLKTMSKAHDTASTTPWLTTSYKSGKAEIFYKPVSEEELNKYFQMSPGIKENLPFAEKYFAEREKQAVAQKPSLSSLKF